MIAKATIKSWGSSLGLIVPRNIVHDEGLQEGDQVVIDIQKGRSARHLFGRLRDWKIDSQKVKDQLRKEWAL